VLKNALSSAFTRERPAKNRGGKKKRKKCETDVLKNALSSAFTREWTCWKMGGKETNEGQTCYKLPSSRTLQKDNLLENEGGVKSKCPRQMPSAKEKDLPKETY
jgi:hypothetical protein